MLFSLSVTFHPPNNFTVFRRAPLFDPACNNSAFLTITTTTTLTLAAFSKMSASTSTPASAAPAAGKLSRSEFRRQKDLEEDRKAGRAPAELDEDGNIINPHVPSYMAQAPWYMDTGSRSLKHQKKPLDPNAPAKAGLNDWYSRSPSTSTSEVKKGFRKGACENCGSMSHKTRDCLERPRKKGAKKLGKTLAGDSVLQEPKGLDYAAKRDRWNGYDPSEHKKVVAEFEAIEEERRRLKEEQIDAGSSLKHAKKLAGKEKKEGDFSSDDSEDSDDERYADRADAVGQHVDHDKRMTIRNLRIREDRAKYLYNLDPNSAYYDPKTRTMREAPNPHIPPSEAEYAGDNFHRAQGSQAGQLANLQLFSWQAEARTAASSGSELNLQANPTANERQYKEYQERKEALKSTTRSSVLDKYGGAEHFDSLPSELLRGQSERYVEYNQSGKVVKGEEEKKVVKSRWEEGVTENNHTEVWGSWYDMGVGEWGYACCRSRVWNSYCTGQAGVEADMAANANEASGRNSQSKAGEASKESKENGHTKASAREGEKASKRKRTKSRSLSPSPSYSSSDSSSSSRSHRRHHRSSRSRSHRRRSPSPPPSTTGLDRTKLQQAILEEKAKSDPALAAKLADERKRKHDALPDWLKDAEAINAKVKRTGGDGGGTEVTEEQMEAYRLVNRHAAGGVSEDPMANYRDEEDEL